MLLNRLKTFTDRAMPSIKDVADAAGVSTASVSRVLSGIAVRRGVRERVLSAVTELGYRPNRVARSLRSAKSTTIGLIVADIQNTFFTEVCRAVEDAASRDGYAVFLCNSDEDADKEATYLQLLRDENVAGVILAPTAEALRAIGPDAAPGMPIVVIDRPVSGLAIDTIVVDNVAAADDLTAHLLGHGRRRIAGLFGAHSATGRERHKGFVAAHTAAGVAPHSATFLAPREDDGFETTMRLLSQPDRPDAIVTSNGLLALGAYRALMESGLRCPQDVAFGAFDNAKWTSLVRPPLTVIEQPTYEIGRTATELLLSRLNQPDRSSRSIALPHKLVVRESCGCGSRGRPTP